MVRDRARVVPPEPVASRALVVSLALAPFQERAVLRELVVVGLALVASVAAGHLELVAMVQAESEPVEQGLAVAELAASSTRDPNPPW
jgi:hypothetical protein